MTAQKLYEILSLLDSLDSTLALQTTLEAVRDALNTVVSAPAQPQHQSTLANALASFSTAAAKLGSSITPSQSATIEAMGGTEFFDPSIAGRVTTSIQTNAMTPSVARDFVQDLAARRSAFMATVRSARQSLGKLKISGSTVEPGSADLAFLIPRDIFDNNLGRFAKELNFIDRLLQDFSEALTGQAEPVKLEQLSSSIPTIGLEASAKVIGAIADVVNWFLSAWGKVEEIRKMRSGLDKMGLKGKALEELTERITTTVDEVVEESTELVLANYPGSESRRNELRNAIEQDVRRLFGQIERGLTVEFRVEPKKGGGDTQKTLEHIAELSQGMRFPQIANEPMLLVAGKVLEGDIQTVRHSKKTTTRRTTTSTKAPQQGSETKK